MQRLAKRRLELLTRPQVWETIVIARAIIFLLLYMVIDISYIYLTEWVKTTYILPTNESIYFQVGYNNLHTTKD